MEPYIGVIGGSGLYEFLKFGETLIVETPYGPTPRILIGEVDGKRVAFVNRHSKPGSKEVSHSVPPHMINYRAIIWGLRKIGVERIYATNAVGSLRPDLKPGTMAVTTQFIDFTKGRASTFYNGENLPHVPGRFKPKSLLNHVDMTRPYCPELRRILLEAAKHMGVKVVDGVTYACMEGPRFETAAEIRMLRVLGADVVGMTLVPEVVLARELNMCYLSIGVVTNLAAGLQERVSQEEVKEIFKTILPTVRGLLIRAIEHTPRKRTCGCTSLVEEE